MHPADDMRAFVLVVERRSFSAAADQLGCTPSGVSKLVSRLEDRLAVRLLHRTTRRLALTPEGERYYMRAREIVGAIDEIENEVSRAGATPRGRLRVNCGKGVMVYALAPILPDFLARYPQIDLDIAVADRIVDLIAAGADVAVRTGPVTDTSLVVRRIAQVERRIFASPAYLARRGTPFAPTDLAGHDCIIIAGGPGLTRWPFRNGEQVRHFEVANRIVVDDAEAALRLAVSGAGLVRVSDVVAGPAVRSGHLVPILTDTFIAEQVPISAIYPHGRHRLAKVRAFVDFLVDRLSPAPWRVPPTAGSTHAKFGAG
jgi:DNA-binding transcriptional LysR family regulator